VVERKLPPSLQSTLRSKVMKEDNTTQKLVFALALCAVVSLAVWTGLATDVEAPAQAESQTAGMLTPF
jgi:thiosulfate reductase cytochrome b subunit